jgi:hypothetical protein
MQVVELLQQQQLMPGAQSSCDCKQLPCPTSSNLVHL